MPHFSLCATQAVVTHVQPTVPCLHGLHLQMAMRGTDIPAQCLFSTCSTEDSQGDFSPQHSNAFPGLPVQPQSVANDF